MNWVLQSFVDGSSGSPSNLIPNFLWNSWMKVIQIFGMFLSSPSVSRYVVMVLTHLETAVPWQQVSVRCIFLIGVFPSAKVQMYASITLRDCSALLRSP